jgi:hypothetical protein
MDISSYRQLVSSPIALVTGANKGIGFEISPTCGYFDENGPVSW